MAPKTFKNSEVYFDTLEKTFRTWSINQRTAFAAAMAERWLPVYQAFSKEEQWGDPAVLRKCLDTVWDHLLGKKVSNKDIAGFVRLVQDNTPHMDDFDAEEALAAAVIVRDAVESCKPEDNNRHALDAALSGIYAVEPEWDEDSQETVRQWNLPAVRDEVGAQWKLVEAVASTSQFDNQSVQALRALMAKPEFAGRVAPRSQTSVGITNQAAFDQYRLIIEMDLKSKRLQAEQMKGISFQYGVMLFAEWASRYTRRRNILDGVYGQLTDKHGLQALLVWNRARDAADLESPAWDPEIRSAIDLCLRNPMNNLDVSSISEPHKYGPSLRRLWWEAKRQGLTDAQGWQVILEWARHRPTAWEQEDQRKKKKQLEMQSFDDRAIHWDDTGDSERPWAAKVDGVLWQVRLNDFPDDFLYTLLINEKETVRFLNWPETWQRS